MRVRWAVLWMVLALAAPAQAQTTWFSSSWTAGNFPTGNWDSYDSTHAGTYYTATRVAGGCPDGNDSVSVQFISVGTHAQFQYGWGVDPSGFAAAVTAGSTFYLKYRIKPNASLNLVGNTPENVFFMKFIMFAANVDTQRFITNLIDNGVSSDNFTVQPMLNVGGGARGSLTLGSWNAVIERFVMASTASANDGAMYSYIATSGTFALGTPTTSNTGLDMEVNAGRTGFGLGRFTQGTLASGGSAGYEICNVVLTDTFDSNWPTAGGSTPAGPARTLLMHVGEARLDWPLWLGLLGSVGVVAARRRSR